MPFWVRFFLLLAEKHFFLALIRKSAGQTIFRISQRGGVFGVRQNKEREARAVWEFPVSQCRPLSAVPLLRGRRGRIYTDFLLRYLTTAL